MRRKTNTVSGYIDRFNDHDGMSLMRRRKELILSPASQNRESGLAEALSNRLTLFAARDPVKFCCSIGSFQTEFSFILSRVCHGNQPFPCYP